MLQLRLAEPPLEVPLLDLLDHIPADPRGRERAVDADRAGADLDDGPVG